MCTNNNNNPKRSKELTGRDLLSSKLITIPKGIFWGLATKSSKTKIPIILKKNILNFSPKKSPSKENLETIPDSFRQYRAQPNRDASDSEESNQSSNRSTCSSCSDFSDSRSGSDFG